MTRFMTEAQHAARTLERQGLSEQVAPVPALLERDIQGPILRALLSHKSVAFAWRANAGKFQLGDMYGHRWITINFRGCSDLLGMLKNGKFLAVEVKTEGKSPTADQQAFLDRVNANRGVAFVAQSVADVHVALADL